MISQIPGRKVFSSWYVTLCWLLDLLLIFIKVCLMHFNYSSITVNVIDFSTVKEQFDFIFLL